MRDIISPNHPKNAVPDRELTPEFVAKWDLDLVTIAGLDKLAHRLGCGIVFKGGIATEAHAGGHQTRSHNDIDATFINTKGLGSDEIFNAVDKLIMSEDTKWKLYSNKPEKIEYREEEDERPFFDRRRLELMIRDEFDGSFESKKLVFSDGREIEIEVPEIYGFVAHKIRKLFMVNDGIEIPERETNRSDYTDLKRLIELPGFDREKAIESLSKVFKKVKNPASEAEIEYKFVMELLDQV